MFATGVPIKNAEPIEVITIDDCKRNYEQERKKIDEFGNPDKFLCLRYSSEDGCSKFEAVDMKFGYGYSDLPDSDELEELKYPSFGSFGSVVCCVGCWFSKDGKRNISGFSFDLNFPDLGWTEAPNLKFSSNITQPFLYKDGFSVFTEQSWIAEVYNPIPINNNPPCSNRIEYPGWPESKPDYIVMSDPCSDRILVCFPDNGHLYACYPNNREFKLLARDFPVSFCSPLGAIADGVLYMHHSGDRPIGAYDLEEMKMIDVDWELKCGWGIDDEYQLWSGFFHLGDGILCLARCDYEMAVKSSVVTVVYFKVRKQRDERRGLSILASPGPCYKFQIDTPNFYTATFFTMDSAFLPLKDYGWGV